MPGMVASVNQGCAGWFDSTLLEGFSMLGTVVGSSRRNGEGDPTRYCLHEVCTEPAKIKTATMMMGMMKMRKDNLSLGLGVAQLSKVLRVRIRTRRIKGMAGRRRMNSTG